MGIYDQLARADEQNSDKQIKKAGKEPKFAPPPRRQTKQTSQQARRNASRHDVVASFLNGVSLRAWRDVVEDTETHNSALRLTAAERDRVEDMVRDLRRKHKIKTSMNELGRIGLLLLEHDFRQRGKASVIHRVKDA